MMVLVTDKQYYMNHNLKDLLDLCKKREDKKWDNCIIIDGKERAGKSTLAKTMAYYYSHITGKKFDEKDIYFNPTKLTEAAVSTRKRIFIWDEAAMGGQSFEWQNKELKKLNTTLMVAGKYGHFFIFIIPSFFRLHRYLAIDRSIALFHVYSPDMIARGDYLCLNEQQKTWVYNNNRKSESYGSSYSFSGSWALKNTENLVNEMEYERMKDEAIINNTKKDEKVEKRNTYQKKLIELRAKLLCMYSRQELKEKFGLKPTSYNNWVSNAKDMGFPTSIENKTTVLPAESTEKKQTIALSNTIPQ